MVTPDRFPGTREEDELALREDTTDPSVEGRLRYVSGAWRLVDSIGVYDPRGGGGLPPATEVGQFLFSYNGTTFEIVKPIVTDDGFLVTDDDGHLVVTG